MNRFNSQILSKKINVLNQRLQKLKKYKLLEVKDLVDDDIQDIIERNLEILIQSAIDINKSILKNLMPSRSMDLGDLTSSDSFLLLAQSDILNEELAIYLAQSAKFRNVLAHLYDQIIPEKLIDALQEALKHYPNYLYAIQSYLDSLE